MKFNFLAGLVAGMVLMGAGFQARAEEAEERGPGVEVFRCGEGWGREGVRIYRRKTGSLVAVVKAFNDDKELKGRWVIEGIHKSESGYAGPRSFSLKPGWGGTPSIRFGYGRLYTFTVKLPAPLSGGAMWCYAP